jgi:putative transposase
VTKRKKLLDTNTAFSITRQAELLGIARSSVYRKPTSSSRERLVFLNAVDEIYTARPFYGQRRIRVILEHDYGIVAGRDAIRTAMKTLGVRAIYPKPKTSTAHPEHRIYPYLLRNVSITKPNHVWGTDITYIRLEGGFCYLVALLDWYSRRVLAWRLSNSMETSFCREALSEALTIAVPTIHNSDQGVQFTSNEYLDVLRTHDTIKISMDGRGRCMDNIFTERLWRTVKYEDVYLKGYSTIDEVRDGLTDYFCFYNKKRPHQALDYKTPDEVYYQR